MQPAMRVMVRQAPGRATATSVTNRIFDGRDWLQYLHQCTFSDVHQPKLPPDLPIHNDIVHRFTSIFPIGSCVTCSKAVSRHPDTSGALAIHPGGAGPVCHESNWAQRSCRDATFMRRQLKDFPTMADSSTANYIELAADIVSAYVSNNSVSAGDLPGLINSVHNALLNVTSGKVEAPAEPLKPVVPVKKSITPTTSSASRTVRSSSR